jgi:hypothetical protein
MRNIFLYPFYYNLPVFIHEDLDHERLDQSDRIKDIFFSIPDCFE